MSELKPCPICGRKATGGSWWSDAEECGIATVGCSRESYVNGYECARILVMRIDEKVALKDAVRIWNTRTPEQGCSDAVDFCKRVEKAVESREPVTLFGVDYSATQDDDDYERRMDELLCNLTNGKWSKSRSYSVGFMVACVTEEFEDAIQGCGECELEINADATAVRCSFCGYSLPKGTDLAETRFCGGCGKAVKR